MHIETDVKLDFCDVLVRPKRSILSSGSEANIERRFRFRHCETEWTGFPLIASNMDTIGTVEMAVALCKFNALVALHKYYPTDRLISFFNSEISRNSFDTLGTSSDDWAKLSAVKAQTRISMISLDVANGYTEQFIDAVSKLRTENPTAIIMAGTVVTAENYGSVDTEIARQLEYDHMIPRCSNSLERICPLPNITKSGEGALVL